MKRTEMIQAINALLPQVKTTNLAYIYSFALGFVKNEEKARGKPMYEGREEVVAEITETLRGSSYTDLLRVNIYAKALQTPSEEGVQ